MTGADRFARDLLAAPGTLLDAFVHAVLVALLTLAEVILVGGFFWLGVVLLFRYAVARYDCWRFVRTGTWWVRP